MPEPDLVQELALAKAAAAEWLAKYEQAEKRISITWDMALHEARVRLGRHVPKCFAPCDKCWFHDELGKMMRIDHGNYIPVRERLHAAGAVLKETCVGAGGAMAMAYEKGIDDLLIFVDTMLSDRQ